MRFHEYNNDWFGREEVPAGVQVLAHDFPLPYFSFFFVFIFCLLTKSLARTRLINTLTVLIGWYESPGSRIPVP